MNNVGLHVHKVEGGWLIHDHDLGPWEGPHKALRFTKHTHLIVLSERNFVNEKSSPPLLPEDTE